MTSFRTYYAAFVRSPRAAAGDLASDPRALRLGLLAMAVPTFGYLVVYLGLARGGAYPSTFSPWLAIPAEHYYETNVYLIVPSMAAGWLLSAALVQLLGHAVGAKGSFEGTLAALGFAISIGHWTLLPHDLVVSVLGALHVIDALAHEHAMNAPTLARDVLWAFMLVYTVVFPWMFSAVIAGVHGLDARRAGLLGVLGFAAYQVVFLLFNR